MKKLLKPASIGFSILMLLVFFFVGIYIAKWVGAGKNQMLAGGAIVFFYGVVAAGIAFVASLFITYYVAHKKIVVLNWVLLAILLIACAVTYISYKQQHPNKEEPVKQPPKKVTAPAPDNNTANLIIEIPAINKETSVEETADSNMGMGYFAPNYYENPTLYFYGDINLEKSIIEHTPYDSITFKRNKYNQFEIATAPPWLVPDIMKLDYGFLYFKIQSVSQDFIEITVNAQTHQTSHVSRSSGKIRYWPDFLLNIHSIEFIPGYDGKARVRPFEASGVNQVKYEFMRPLSIKNDWVQVLLLDDNFKKVGEGWIRWRKEEKLLIQFNLLS